MRAHPSRQRGPTDEAQYNRDEEKPFLCAPGIWNKRGQRHKKRDGGDRAHRIRDHLDKAVDPAPIEPGYAPDNQGKHERDEHPDRPHGKRGIDRMEGTRKDILASGIGTKQVDVSAVDSEKMGVERHPKVFIL